MPKWKKKTMVKSMGKDMNVPRTHTTISKINRKEKARHSRLLPRKKDGSISIKHHN